MKNKKNLYIAIVVLALLLNAWANIKLFPEVTTYGSFHFLNVAIIVYSMLAIVFDIFARKEYGLDTKYAMFWVGILIIFLGAISIFFLFPQLPQLLCIALFLTTYAVLRCAIDIIYLEKVGIFKEKI